MIFKQIKQIREMQKISQVELAKRAHVTQATISHIEGGKDIQLRILLKVLKALGWGVVLTPLPKIEGGN